MSTNFSDTALDRAISLYRQQKYSEARFALQTLIARNPSNITAWNVLGYLERDVGDAAAAANAFEHTLKLQPDDYTGLKGRARIALERAESDVLHRYAAAARVFPGDPHLFLEQTEARLSQGDTDAIDEFAQFMQHLPEWTEGQIALGRMLWETRRDKNFADHIRLLLSRDPKRLDLWMGFIALLSGSGQYEAAADAARDTRIIARGGEEFALMEAVHAGRAGDVDRAEALFKVISPNIPGRLIHESVHYIRQGKLDRALGLIETMLAEDPLNLGAWAIAELIYRKLGSSHSAWLSCQEGLVRTFDLPLDSSRLQAVTSLLLQLHRSGVQMVDQSIRAGTQTRWRLFDRLESELADLKRAIEIALDDYIAGLPPRDDNHPLLRHRDAPLRITGSWSVRLTGSGYHVSHIHPLGLISSACYFVIPDPTSGGGCLELGRPPPDLRLDLEPAHVIQPKPGLLVLFPSYFHHGTRPFASGERLTVAFDVHRYPAPPLPAC